MEKKAYKILYFPALRIIRPRIFDCPELIKLSAMYLLTTNDEPPLPDQTFWLSSILHTFEFGPGDVPKVCRTYGAFSCDCGSSPLRLPDLD